MFYALHEGLTLIEEEGLAHRCERHHKAHHQFVKTIERMGLEMLVPEGHRIWNLNTVRVPAGVDDAKVRATLLNEHGIEIAGGFGQLAGKIFRIGIMGPLATPEHVDDFLVKFSAALGKAGYKG
jgi:alanine-glyoxylate transaminase/serine-glyoxylate transaminase/serine-pyruvate transaminase